jgi:hypothetical protein
MIKLNSSLGKPLSMDKGARCPIEDDDISMTPNPPTSHHNHFSENPGAESTS